jgi:hypothetical protein
MGKHTVEIELPDGYEPTGESEFMSGAVDIAAIRLKIRKVKKWRPARFADLQKIYASGGDPIKARFRADNSDGWIESKLTGWNGGLWIDNSVIRWSICEVLDED